MDTLEGSTSKCDLHSGKFHFWHRGSGYWLQISYTGGMNTKGDKDVWADVNMKAGITFAVAVITLAVVYLVFFK